MSINQKFVGELNATIAQLNRASCRPYLRWMHYPAPQYVDLHDAGAPCIPPVITGRFDECDVDVAAASDRGGEQGAVERGFAWVRQGEQRGVGGVP